MYRVIEEFDLYEINEEQVIRHRYTGNIKSPHRGTDKVRLYKDGKEYTRKIVKLFEATFPEVLPGKELLQYPSYRITEDGRVYSLHEAKYLSPAKTKKGYLSVSLRTPDGRSKSELVHRLVAKCYLGYSDLDVNHIDGNKSNNCVNNLEWVTKSENILHAVDTGLYDSKMRTCLLTKDGITIKFDSIVDAAKFIGTQPEQVRNVMVKNLSDDINSTRTDGKYICKGYIAEYIETDGPKKYNTDYRKLLITKQP